MFLSFPRILLGGIFILMLLSGTILFCQQNAAGEKQKNSIRIGVAAQKDEPFVDWMISVVSNMKSMEYDCRFETTIVTFLLKQLSEAASSFILNSEAGIYTMQEYYSHHNLPNKAEDELELNLQYIKDIAGLEKGMKTETIETGNTYPLVSQYIISGFVLFLLLWGLAAGKMLEPRNKAFQEQLINAGMPKGRQLLARGLSFLSTSLVNYLVLFLLISIAMLATGTALPDTMVSDIAGLWKFAACCLPLLLASSVTIQAVYEITGDALGGALLLFFGVLVLALCSGCFYPLSYLPESLQKLAPKLPLYQACQYGLAVLYR